MALVRNLFFLFAVTVFASASLILDMFNYNPYEASQIQFINFYFSLFFSLAGISSFIIYYSKLRLLKDSIIFTPFWSSVRQGILIGSSISLIFFLRGLRLSDWLVGISIIVVAALLELFFQTKRPAVIIKKQLSRS